VDADTQCLAHVTTQGASKKARGDATYGSMRKNFLWGLPLPPFVYFSNGPPGQNRKESTVPSAMQQPRAKRLCCAVICTIKTQLSDSPARTKLVALIFSAKSSTVVRTRGLCCPCCEPFGEVDAADRRCRTCRCCGICPAPLPPALLSRCAGAGAGAGARLPCEPGLAKAAGSAMPIALARSCLCRLCALPRQLAPSSCASARQSTRGGETATARHSDTHDWHGGALPASHLSSIAHALHAKLL
jgi:hypothetical protein